MIRPLIDLNDAETLIMCKAVCKLVSQHICYATILMVLIGCRTEPDIDRDVAEPDLMSKPLGQLTGHPGKLFDLVPSSESGIDFTHRWMPTTDDAKVLFDGPFSGGGVCIGDYDNDDQPDVFLTRPFGGNRLFRNLGDFRFEDVTKQAGLSDELSDDAWGAGPSFVDINGDGHLDLYVCAYNQPNRLYINDGNGKFAERAAQYGLDFNGASVTMAFSDYDVDGDMDGFLVTYRKVQNVPPAKFGVSLRAGRYRVPKEHQEVHDVMLRPPNNTVMLIRAGQVDHLFRNDKGRFVDVTRGALGDAAEDGYFGLSARWWDYNNDGYPDLYVSNDFYGPDQFFHNNRDGTFREITKDALPYTPWFSMGTDAADINNDGRLDFMAADMAATSHYKSKLNMGDMDQSGWFLDSAEPRQYMSNALFINTGTARFQEAASMAGVSGTDWTWALKFADFDLDGLVDLYATNGMTRNWFNSDLRSAAKEESKSARVSWLERWKDEPRLNEENAAFRNEGNLRFTETQADWGLDHTGVSFGSAVGDLDGDGDLDIVTVNFDDAVHLYRNQSAAKQRVSIKLRGSQSNKFGIGALVTIEHGDQMQCRDLATTQGFFSGDNPQVHFGLGASRTIDRLTVRWPGGYETTYQDLPANHSYTIRESKDAVRTKAKRDVGSPLFTRNSSFGELRHIESTFNDFEREPLLPNRLSRFGPGLACGDINGDGIDDLYLGGAKGEPGALALSAAKKFNLEISTTTEKSRQHEVMGCLLFEADGDGDLDLYIASGGVECDEGGDDLQDRLLLNDGNGNFFPAAEDSIPEVRESSSVVAAADFDRDGDLDLFVGGRSVPGKYPENCKSFLLQNDSGKFTIAPRATAPDLEHAGLVTSGVWSDIDSDGWMDLLITTEWGPVRLYKNRSGVLKEETEAAGLSHLNGWWNGIASSDFDNDGDMDYVVTNFGVNNKYHPTPDHPVVLFYGDMVGDGKKSIVEAKYHKSDLLPVRGRSCSTNAMPHLGKKFPSYHKFANAVLTDIYEDKLTEAKRFEASILESGLLINDGTGRLTFQPLPRIAQVAPGFGVVATDVNADGASDIYFVQNFYHPQRETVRMSAGVSQLLLGDGAGNFESVNTVTCNLLVPGDARGLATIDLNNDSRPDFVVTQNDDQVLSFTNSTIGNDIPLRIKLRGRQGNPTAVGARVTINIPGCARQTAEVCSGGSYLSQSSADLFFGGGKKTDALCEIDVTWPDGSKSHQTAKVSESPFTLARPIKNN